jgi:sec-independent protein translocase protein TatC
MTQEASGNPPEENLKVMGLMDHLGELRGRVVKSFLAIVILFMIAFTFADLILNHLKGPLVDALPEGSQALHFTGPMDVLIANIKVSFLVAIVAGCPVWLYQFWKFLEPALYQHEKKWVLPFVFASVILFFSGVLFCFFVILPEALSFLIGYGLQVGEAIITVTDYISLVMILIFGFGFIFETPVIIVLMAMMDLVSADALAKNRKYVLVGILLIGALITPPDPISQVLMAVPTYIMYEVSIVIIRIVKRKRVEEP